jgi:decaprenylphospho-beta-D-erythro-pentofuranosid-2-ulose 2-reductase
MPQWNHAVVVGASSGLGEAIARRLAREGTHVSLVARRLEVLEAVAKSINGNLGRECAVAYRADVRNVGESQRTFEEIIETGPPVDLIVYSSGVMPKGSREGFPTDEDVSAIATNFTGAVVWLNAAATYFGERGHGTIVGIGSIAGDRGRQGNPVYNATKAGLATYLEALRSRLKPRGVVVVTIKPGLMRTPMLGSRPGFKPAIRADAAAWLVLKATRKGRRTAYVPPWWAAIAFLIKIMPPQIMERVKT